MEKNPKQFHLKKEEDKIVHSPYLFNIALSKVLAKAIKTTEGDHGKTKWKGRNHISLFAANVTVYIKVTLKIPPQK